MKIDKFDKYLKFRLNTNCLIFEEYLAYLVIRKKYNLTPNFWFIHEEFDLIKQICDNGNIKYKCREDLENIKPLLLNVLIKLVKQKLDETKLEFENAEIEDEDFNFSDYKLHLNEIYNKREFFIQIKERIELTKDINVLNQINLRIYILQIIEEKLNLISF